MTIGEKIKKARSLRGLTQKELAFLVDLPDVRIRQYEIDARTPKEDVLQNIAGALGFPIEFFTSCSLESYIDAIQTFNVLEQKFGFSMKKAGRANGKQIYNVTFDDTSLESQIDAWLDGDEEIAFREFESNNAFVKQFKTERELWKYRFPLSHDEKTRNKLLEERRKNRKENPSD